ncbi:MAG: ABC transporter ATP-binding protein [Nitriliruptoraceae bacterium]
MLTLEALTKRFGSVVALDQLSVEVAEGEVLALLGPSGCGKSTALRVVAGLERADDGRVLVDDQVLSDRHQQVPPERRPVNMVFQDYALWPHMTVEEIVGYGLAQLKVPSAQRRARTHELMGLLEIAELASRRPSELSGGQQQRVAIARAVATRPRLLLFDEPLSNLDTRLRHAMRAQLDRLLGELGTTALYVTHDVEEAFALADRILVLQDGRTVQCDVPEAIFAAPATPWVARLAGFSCALQAGFEPRSGATSAVTIAGQTVTARRLGDGHGQEGIVLLHPDAVVAADDAHRLQGPTNRLRGVVRQSLFAGRTWQTFVALPDGQEVELRSVHRHAPGEDLDLHVAVHDTLGFADVGAARTLEVAT